MEETGAHLRGEILRADQAIRHFHALEVSEVTILSVEEFRRCIETISIFWLDTGTHHKIPLGWWEHALFSVIGLHADKLLRSTCKYIESWLLIVAALNVAEALHEGVARVGLPILLTRIESLCISIELFLSDLHLVVKLDTVEAVFMMFKLLLRHVSHE